MARASTVVPPSGSSCFGRPMRVDVPAARMTALTGAFGFSVLVMIRIEDSSIRLLRTVSV